MLSIGQLAAIFNLVAISDLSLFVQNVVENHW